MRTIPSKILILILFCLFKIESLFSSIIHNHFPIDKQAQNFLIRSLKDDLEIEKRLISFSNINLLIRERLGSQWVLRIPNEISNILSDRAQEREMLIWAQQEGLSLIEIQDCDLEKGYILTRFLPGQSHSATDFQNLTELQSALTLLHRIHSSKTAPLSNPKRFFPLDRFIVTSRIAMQKGFSLPVEVQKIALQLEELLAKIPNIRFQCVPCHNDPSPENFFYQNDALYLHDWEFVGWNDPMWDLTHFSVIAQVDPQKILNLYPTTDPLAWEKMVFFKPFVLFNTLVWAASESQLRFSTIPPETTTKFYQIFLEQTADSVNSNAFQAAFLKLLQGSTHE